MSTLGDPLTDLAHLLVYWEPTCGRVTHESQAIAGHPGFLSGSELVARYAAASGRDVDGLSFYLAFEHWRAAIIKEAIFQRRHADPDDTNDELGDSVARHLEEAADLLATVTLHCVPRPRRPLLAARSHFGEVSFNNRGRAPSTSSAGSDGSSTTR